MLDAKKWIKNIQRMDPVSAFHKSQRDNTKDEVVRINSMLQRQLSTISNRLNDNENFQSLVEDCNQALKKSGWMNGTILHLRGRNQYERMDVTFLSTMLLIQSIEFIDESIKGNTIRTIRTVLPYLNRFNKKEADSLYFLFQKTMHKKI